MAKLIFGMNQSPDGGATGAVTSVREYDPVEGRMTANSYPFEHAFLARAVARIINEVKGINRVVYEVTSKPPGTIERE
ncbi:MAG TPA: hypothetical protein VGL35_12870 [Rhizomicrobium sp.]|jgi:GMP synthase (glutamine-hydrolysing)